MGQDAAGIGQLERHLEGTEGARRTGGRAQAQQFGEFLALGANFQVQALAGQGGGHGAAQGNDIAAKAALELKGIGLGAGQSG